MAIPWLLADSPLPPTSTALDDRSEAPGLLAAGGGLSIARLRDAYAHGVFPWYSPGQPVLWWSPDPRMLLRTADFRLSRSLRKTLRRFLRTPGCEVRFDHDVARVMAHCADTPRDGQDGTWIVPEMQAAYTAWARTGDVHSVETWIDGELVGGLYGVNLGRMMFGESMFSHRTDASKIALAALVAFCRVHDMPAIDCQQATGHLATLGASPVPRAAFEREVHALVSRAPAPVWAYDFRLWDALDLGSPVPASTAAPSADLSP
ncbi:MAG: leucyl/phenylalanyl-tRNA--protein transferase [Burkholderiales bacterium]|nr:leucyl/phenylalanyl-tRNA--protein transferase [Burkholderiales bacterium]